MNIEPIAYIHTDLPTKFGLPRQSGIIEELKGEIIFEPKYRDPEAFKGLGGYDYIWVLWDFSKAHRKNWSATVCPPMLGGKTHMGVFATRSPFRPNSIGLSSVRLEGIVYGNNGPVLKVSGIDMMDKTPIYDIKPYIPRYDSHPDAKSGFAGEVKERNFTIEDPLGCIKGCHFTAEQENALIKILKEDPRPRYDLKAGSDGTRDDAAAHAVLGSEHLDSVPGRLDSGTDCSDPSSPDRVYGFYYRNFDVRFRVDGDVLTIVEIADRCL